MNKKYSISNTIKVNFFTSLKYWKTIEESGKGKENTHILEDNS